MTANFQRGFCHLVRVLPVQLEGAGRVDRNKWSQSRKRIPKSGIGPIQKSR